MAVRLALGTVRTAIVCACSYDCRSRCELCYCIIICLRAHRYSRRLAKVSIYCKCNSSSFIYYVMLQWARSSFAMNMYGFIVINLCFLQGNVATLLRCGGKNYSRLRRVSS